MNIEIQGMKLAQPEEKSVEQEEKTLKITNEITSYLDGAGKWGKFLSILGFVFMGLMVVIGIIMSIALSFIPLPETGMFPFPPFLIGFIYLIIGTIYFLPILYLYRFSTGIKQALQLKNQNQFAKAFFNLKALYRFIGILMIVFLVLYPIIIIAIVFAGLFSGFSNSFGVPV
ncbi:MAG TPA: hypothetical protein VKA38_04000 [Draconibacterium sp.]|nr:hypothetical protein [Draconibacterium sp.]